VKREVSRIEGFSDAVFGFALTLLVVSLEVPHNIADLKHTLSGFLPFAASFAIISWIWFEHYLFFRKVGVEDGTTITLNCTLLFVVLFFVYPLKFIFSTVIPAIFGQGANELGPMSAADGRLIMVGYGVGFVAVWLIFVLMYRDSLQKIGSSLSALELFDARSAMRRHMVSLSIGLLSIVTAFLLPGNMVGLAGLVYGLQGPAHAMNGYFSGKARAKILLSSN